MIHLMRRGGVEFWTYNDRHDRLPLKHCLKLEQRKNHKQSTTPHIIHYQILGWI